MRLLYSLIAISLIGCSTAVPVTAKFPQAPDMLMTKCPELDQLQSGSVLSDVAKNVTKNYSTYYECSSKHAAFIEWYNTQKTIFEEVK